MSILITYLALEDEIVHFLHGFELPTLVYHRFVSLETMRVAFLAGLGAD